MKYLLVLVLCFCGFAYAQPRYPGDDRPIVTDRDYGPRPQYDTKQKRCEYLFREKRLCGDDWRCERRFDRRIRNCLTR